MGEKQGVYSMDRENKVSKICIYLYLYCVSDGFGNDFYSRRMALIFLTHLESK